MTLLALAFAAGLLTVASPCVLPALPLIAASALSRHRFAPVAMVTGLVVSFTVVGLALASIGGALGLQDTVVRAVAAWLLIAAGLSLLIPGVQVVIERLLSPVATAAARAGASPRWSGLGGHFVVGGLLGAIWSPCVGPTLGAASGLAAQADTFGKAAAVSVAFGFGASMPLLAIAYGSRGLVNNRAIHAGLRVAKPAFGVVLAALGTATLSGADKQIEAAVLDHLPSWWVTAITRF